MTDPFEDFGKGFVKFAAGAVLLNVVLWAAIIGLILGALAIAGVI